MKDSIFVADSLPSTAREGLLRLAARHNEPFDVQVLAAGLNRATDLQHADLDGIDVSYSDLRGFNFTGASLRHVAGVAVTWDQTTILNSADVEGSIFATELRLRLLLDQNNYARDVYERIARADWAQQVLWAADNLLPSGPHREIAFEVTEALFLKATDSFLKSQLLRFLAPRFRVEEELRDLLVGSLAQKSASDLMTKTAVQLLVKGGFHQEPAVRQIALRLATSGRATTQVYGLQLLLRTHLLPTEQNTIMARVASGDEVLGAILVAETARTLGGDYSVVVRDPITGDYFQPGHTVDGKTTHLVARALLRAETDRLRGEMKHSGHYEAVPRRPGPFRDTEIASKIREVRRMWNKLASLGVVINHIVPPDDEQPSHQDL